MQLLQKARQRAPGGGVRALALAKRRNTRTRPKYFSQGARSPRRHNRTGRAPLQRVIRNSHSSWGGGVDHCLYFEVLIIKGCSRSTSLPLVSFVRYSHVDQEKLHFLRVYMHISFVSGKTGFTGIGNNPALISKVNQPWDEWVHPKKCTHIFLLFLVKQALQVLETTLFSTVNQPWDEWVYPKSRDLCVKWPL